MEVYLIAPDKLKNNSFIDDNISSNSILTSIIIAQETMLAPVLGTPLYDKLINDVANDTLTDDYKTLLVEKIHDLLTYYVVYQLIISQSYKIANNGVGKNDYEGTTSLSNEEKNIFLKNIESIYTAYEGSLTRHLAANLDKFPEYDDSSEDGYESDTKKRTSQIFNIKRLM